MLTNGSAIAEGDALPPEDVARPHDIEALGPLYRVEKPRLLSLLRRRASPDEAAEHVQQAFIRLADLDPRRRAAISSPRAYLKKVVLNLSNDAARAALRNSKRAHIPADEVDLVAPDQLAALEARDMLCRLEAALLRLKPRTREIFLAHRFDGYSYAEIAGRTGLSIDAVKWHMSKAIAHIDRLLGPR